MMCQANCGTTVQNALKALDVVEKAQVSYAQKLARIVLKGGAESGKETVANLLDAVDCIGFDAEEGTADEWCDEAVPSSTLASQGLVLGEEEEEKGRAREQQDDEEEDDAEVATAYFRVLGMSSLSDAETVDRRIRQLAGVYGCSVDLLGERCEVECDAARLDNVLESVPRALSSGPGRQVKASLLHVEGAEKQNGNDFALDVVGEHNGNGGSRAPSAASFVSEDGVLTLSVSGMSCAACAAKIEAALKNESWVSDATVSHSTDQCRVWLAPQRASIVTLAGAAGSQPRSEEERAAVRQVVDVVKDLGFGAEPLKRSSGSSSRVLAMLEKRKIVSLFVPLLFFLLLLLLLMLHSLISPVSPVSDRPRLLAHASGFTTGGSALAPPAPYLHRAGRAHRDRQGRVRGQPRGRRVARPKPLLWRSHLSESRGHVGAVDAGAVWRRLALLPHGVPRCDALLLRDGLPRRSRVSILFYCITKFLFRVT